MDNKDLINLFFEVLTLMGTMGAGFFSFWRFSSSKIDKHFEKLRSDFDTHKKDTEDRITRVYERMDEKSKEFVKDDIYQVEKKHHNENVETRFQALMDFMKLRFEQLDKTIEKLVNHDDDNRSKNGN